MVDWYSSLTDNASLVDAHLLFAGYLETAEDALTMPSCWHLELPFELDNPGTSAGAMLPPALRPACGSGSSTKQTRNRSSRSRGAGMTTMLRETAPQPPRPAAGRHDSRILAQRPLNGQSQLRTQALARHGDQIIDGAARYDLEITIHGPLEVETFEFAVDQHCSGTIGVQQHPSTKLGKLGLTRRPGAGPGRARKREPRRRSTTARSRPVGRRRCDGNALRLGNGDEPAVGDADRLRIADKQKAAFAQREVDDGDDLGLRLRQEVDQRFRHDTKSRRENGGSASTSCTVNTTFDRTSAEMR